MPVDVRANCSCIAWNEGFVCRTFPPRIFLGILTSGTESKVPNLRQQVLSLQNTSPVV